MSKLSDALSHIEGIDEFHPRDRIDWIEFRNALHEFFSPLPRDAHPQLQQALRSVSLFPENLPNEGEAWEELRHQAVLLDGS